MGLHTSEWTWLFNKASQATAALARGVAVKEFITWRKVISETFTQGILLGMEHIKEEWGTTGQEFGLAFFSFFLSQNAIQLGVRMDVSVTVYPEASEDIINFLTESQRGVECLRTPLKPNIQHSHDHNHDLISNQLAPKITWRSINEIYSWKLAFFRLTLRGVIWKWWGWRPSCQQGTWKHRSPQHTGFI